MREHIPSPPIAKKEEEEMGSNEYLYDLVVWGIDAVRR
jgi:hypothetical protein